MFKDFASYRRAWDTADQEDPPIPLNIDLEIASLCNLRCPFCFVPDPKFEEFIAQKADDGKPLRRVMPTSLAIAVIDQAAELGVPAIKLNWRGESTIAPNYTEIAEYALEKRRTIWPQAPFFEILANTNANCPDKSIRGLMATTKVMISLDSMVPETYAQMRVGGKLERAKEVIWELVRRGHPNIWVRRVLTKLNAKEDFFGQVKKEWGEKVHVSQHYCFDRNANQANEISGCDHDQAMPRRYCRYPSQRLLITSAGYAYPCCLDLHETMRVGDFNKDTLAEIWTGEPLKKLRASLRANDVSKMTPTCQTCESWMAYDAPQRNFVQDIEILESSGIGESVQA